MTTPKAKFALAVTLLITLTTPSQADFRAGVAAYDRREDTTAFREFKAVAEKGYAKAQFLLGIMYANGEGVPKNNAEAVKWYRKAGEQGYAQAQRNLGDIYYEGFGVPQHYAEAVKWYRKAAEQGAEQGYAQSRLGAMYEKGRGVEQDYVQAHMWFNLSASCSRSEQDMAARAREKIAEKMTSAQIAEAQRLAWEWRPK